MSEEKDFKVDWDKWEKQRLENMSWYERFWKKSVDVFIAAMDVICGRGYK